MPGYIFAFYSWRSIEYKYDIQNVFAVIGLECGWASPTYLHNMYADDFDINGLYWWAREIEKQNEEIKAK